MLVFSVGDLMLFDCDVDIVNDGGDEHDITGICWCCSCYLVIVDDTIPPDVAIPTIPLCYSVIDGDDGIPNYDSTPCI